MISSYLTKETWLHKTPSSLKLVSLSLVTLFATFINELNHALVLLIFSLLIFTSLGRQAHEKLRILIKNFGIIIFLIGIFQTLFTSINSAAVVSMKMLTLILLADLISITTPLSELKRILLKIFKPLAVIGVNADKLSLTMTLSLRLIHIYIALWRRLDISLQSRMIGKKQLSKKRNFQNFKIKKLVTPFLFNAHQSTINIADALHARKKK